MLFSLVGLLWWAAIAVIGADALGTSELEASNWGVVPVELQKGQLDTTYVVPPNNTWVPFFFTNVGSWGFPQFQVTVTQTTAFTQIRCADVFCAGDAFNVYYLSNAINGSFAGRNPSGVASCNNYTVDPNAVSSLLAFYFGGLNTALLGVYNFTVIPRTSPFSAGKGYFKVIYP